MSVEVKELTKLFGAQRAVDGISFNAYKGQILGFLGPNGAGKTTTMKMLCGYLRPSSGEISIAGKPMDIHAVEAKKLIGYLPENNPLYRDMYVREYLSFFAGLCKVPDSKQRIDELIEKTGLLAEQKKIIASLSKGYRQRVGLCQALLHDPEVLVLDEPTSGLDPNQLVEIRKLIKEVGANKTLIFSSHIMQEVQALCDRVLIINKGSIVADGPIESLMQDVVARKKIVVEFTQRINRNEMLGIDGVEDIEDLGNNIYFLFCQLTADPRPELFKLAAQKGWVILELKEEKTNVEQLFNQLTSKK